MAPRSTSRSTKSIRRSTDLDDDVVVGIVRGPHGLRGDVRVEPLSDRASERFRVGSRLRSQVGEVVVSAVRGTLTDPIVHFEGIDDRPSAEGLRGELRVARADARREGQHLWDDLVGRRVVTPEGAELGTVREVLRAGGADVLVVSDDLMLPMIDSVIREIGDVIVAVPQEEA